MIPSFPYKTAGLGTFEYWEMTPCLVQATFCTLSKLVQSAGGKKECEYRQMVSFAVGLN